jgi:hypothetical protein
MIRFRTIDPAEADKPVAKPAEPAPVAQPGLPPEDGKAAPPAKGLTRKTPLRAKKAAPTRLFRD